jgi:serine/threonine protein kinase/tetratricopeptide (TPR) repeat protein
MNDAPPADDPTLESLVACVADAFLQRLERGESPDAEEYVRRYPQHATVLRQVLSSLRWVRDSGAAAASGEPLTVESPLGGRLGDFHIIHEIGRGGMGVVYEAEQISLGRRVALKVLPFASTLDAKQLQRFKNEAQAAAHLHHQSIVPVHATGCERGVHYYAMQFIEGQTLAGVIAELRSHAERERAGSEDSPEGLSEAAKAVLTAPWVPKAEAVPSRPERWATAPGDVSPTSPSAPTTPIAGVSTERPTCSPAYFRTVARFGAQTAEALQHAHDMGVVHRDIKPANLLLDGRGHLWITDFGLAHCQSQVGLTMSGDLVGTLRYMSPEQALAQRVTIDHRTDIYSLGATLYEMLTLEPAFRGHDRHELLRQIAFEEPRPPRRLNKAIPVELETIVLKAMEKNPAERYTTSQEVADDLQRFLDDEPIWARRTSLLRRAAKWSRRHRALVRSATVMLAVAAMILTASVGWVVRDTAARAVETERVVAEALGEASAWQEKRRLPEALSAARRASGLAASGTADDALLRRVRARLADLELQDKLENVRLEITPFRYPASEFALGDCRYGEAFREAGLDVEGLPPAEAGVLIHGSTVAVELAAALDHWAVVRRGIKGPEDTSWKHLLRVARAADPDAGRNRLRDALEQGNRQVLAEWAGSAVALDLAPATLEAFGQILLEIGTDEATVSFLRDAQQRHPDNFWINNMLADALRRSGRPQEEQLRFYTVALALRPQSSIPHFQVGEALRSMGNIDAAIAEYRETIRLNKDFVVAQYMLGFALQQRGRFVDALTELRRARRRGDWPDASDQWIRGAERLVALDQKLAAMLDGKDKPADAGERMELAQFCRQHKQLFAAAARLFAEACEQRKDLAEPPLYAHRYHAACAASLAGCGLGKDAPVDNQERASLRFQALDWLRMDREAWSRLLENVPDKAGIKVLQAMQDWQTDTAFAGVRGPEALAKLPEAERLEWQKLWEEVAALEKRAAEPK